MKNLVNIVQIAVASQQNVAFWGRHGIGKTGAIEQLTSLGFYVKTIILSQSDPLVLGGYPGREAVKDLKGSPVFMTTFAKPQWLSDMEAAAAGGQQVILFLDEFNRADTYAHNVAMRLVNEKEINGHKLPANCTVLAAMNPEDAGDAAIQELTDPMVNRWCHVPVFSDPTTWLKWADSTGVNPFVRGFVRANNERLNGWQMEGMFEKQVLSRIKPTERSNHAVSRILNSFTDDKGNIDEKKLNSGAVFSMIKGLCGSEYAAEFMAFVENNYHQPFTLAEMLKPTKKVMEKADMLRESGHTQVLIASLQIAREQIPAGKMKAKDLKGFWEFIVKCPADAQNAFWYTSDTNSAFWASILALADIPLEVMAALNK
jgi:hypothetical protein